MKAKLLGNRRLWIGGLLVIALLLILVPYLLHPSGLFVGSDDRAAQAISGMQVPVQPWFQPLWRPGSATVTNALFALQATIGLVVIAAFFALKRRQGRG